jgi:phage tail-like protein
MYETSTYTKYLPAVLSGKDPPAPAFSLSTMLRIFEKILTGIPDGVPIQHGTHTHDAIQDVIASLSRRFGAWTAPAADLDWLAQWVALQYPAAWDEYQRRKILAEIVPIYVRRGIKDGLDDFLDIYAVSSRKPRVVVDDSSKVLFVQVPASGISSIYTLVSQEPLIAPHGIAMGPDESFFLADVGNNAGVIINPAVWRLSASGQYDYAGPLVHAQPLGPTPFNLNAPIAVVCDQAVPFGIYILDGGLSFELYYLTSPAYTDAAPLVANAGQLSVPWGIALALDLTGDVLVLDRGALPAAPSNTKIAEVHFVGAPPVFNANTAHALPGIIEPLSLVVLKNGNLVIGDGMNQTLAVPADLVLVDRTNPLWPTSSLLGAVPAANNPLVAPTAIVQEDANHLLVVDAGLKPFVPDPATPFNCVIGRQAAVYRVDLSQVPPTITAVSETRQLTYPRGAVMAAEGRLHICDPGLPDVTGFSTRAWRATMQQFAVDVHFSGPPAVTPLQKQERNQFLQSIADVVIDGKPSQSQWKVISET